MSVAAQTWHQWCPCFTCFNFCRWRSDFLCTIFVWIVFLNIESRKRGWLLQLVAMSRNKTSDGSLSLFEVQSLSKYQISHFVEYQGHRECVIVTHCLIILLTQLCLFPMVSQRMRLPVMLVQSLGWCCGQDWWHYLKTARTPHFQQHCAQQMCLW